jgi:uncharacterized damage-inducible protein DinB
MPQMQDFVKTWENEFTTTLRVFAAFPAERFDYRPHEVSKTARELMWVIASEEGECVGGCLKGKITWGAPKPPKTKDALVREYKKSHQEMVKKVKQAGEDLFLKKLMFPVAKGKMGEISGRDVLWLMLHDQIHHRGQLSVYLRLVGAKVPSIYGPSADEPW